MPVISLTSGKSFHLTHGASILESSASSAVSLPYSCKTGRCSTCKCKVIQGETAVLHAETGLTAKEQDDGWILSCVRTATSDVLIEADDLGEIDIPPVRTLPCRIGQLEKLSSEVIRVFLRIPPTTNFTCAPGQYIDVIGPGGGRRSYSIANADFVDKLLELHIRLVSGGMMSNYWFNEAKVGDLLRFNGPLGTFFLRPSVINRDVIFLATGTGFAPIKAILESLPQVSPSRRPQSVSVFWGGRKREDLYWNLASVKGNFDFVPVLSRPDAQWTGARGYVQQATMARFPDLSNATVYACGSIGMISSAYAELKRAGLPDGHFYSDAFVCSAVN